MTGRTIAHYQILEKLGEGGMGVVYKARDTHLDRFVAIKVLPPEKVADPERKRRFVQEAKAASALNHPNIITIHDIGQADGIDYIAMEYAAGKRLDRLIPRHGMPLSEALKCGVQIADALAAAHGAGIVHRDLKPGNVMVTDKGQVKVLDFGLAKLTETAESGEDFETRTIRDEEAPRTGEGRIMGTAAYMSPEQAQGKKVDARSDIFSFGSLLYEMVTGRRAFQGDSVVSTLAAIIHKEPESFGSKVPHDLEKVITRCLRKDPGRRFQTMADLKVALEELKEESDSGTLETVGPAKVKPPRRLLWAAAVATVVVIAVAGVWILRSRAPTAEEPLTAVPLTSYPGTEDSPSFSPDGTQVAFQWRPEEPGKSCDIYVKQIGVEPPSPLTNTLAFEYSPAWSPDGRTIAFLRKLSENSTSTALVLIPQRGGRERVLAELDGATSPLDGPYLTWTPDSRWLICPVWGAGRWALHLVSVETGQQRRLTSPPADAVGDTSPAVSPDGRTLAFTRESSVAARTDLYLVSLGEGYTPLGEAHRVPSDNLWSGDPSWTPDGNEIVFSSGTFTASGLWRMAASKPAAPRRLPFAPDNAFAPALSRQGNRLAYVVSRYVTSIWRVDLREPGRKRGAPVQFSSSTRRDNQPSYSPDGKRIAFVSNRSGNEEIWICDKDGSYPAQLTSVGASLVRPPRWAPNGESIAFEANPGGNQDVYVVSANGGAARRLTADPGPDQWPDWSPDGQSLYFVRTRGSTKDIWKMPVTGGEAVQITRNTNADIPQVSPDGSFIYYSKGYPNPSSIWRVPAAGGEGTKVLDGVASSGMTWTVVQGGIYFFSEADGKGQSDLSVYEFATGRARKILTIERPGRRGGIAVSPDRRTILFSKADAAGSDLMLVENFK